MQAIDLKGLVFGRLTVIRMAYSDKHGIVWECRCSCSNPYETYGHALRQGKTKSCGCWHREHSGQINRQHGLSSIPEYGVWDAMVQRCTNPNNKYYKNYGGRGIKVCTRWRKFENFLEDMGRRPTGLTLDRVDNDKGYMKSNCQWVTRRKQQNNMRTNVRLTHNGQTLTAAQWAEVIGISANTIYSRLRSGWSVEQTLETPLKCKP